MRPAAWPAPERHQQQPRRPQQGPALIWAPMGRSRAQPIAGTSRQLRRQRPRTQPASSAASGATRLCQLWRGQCALVHPPAPAPGAQAAELRLRRSRRENRQPPPLGHAAGAFGVVREATCKATGTLLCCKSIPRANLTPEMFQDIQIEAEIMMHIRGAWRQHTEGVGW